jgi:DNA/RNA-binding domain of Phe-tRNA-synthetase-like protein
MNITIDRSITEKCPAFSVIAITMDVTIEDSTKISALIKQYERKISKEYSLEDVLNIPLIKEARDAYKAFGKDPSRYRLACESLLRRIVKGNELYRINNLVDAGNILSLETKRSVAVLDYQKIKGDFIICLGKADDEYYGIGRGKINVESIPVYVDEQGPFGSSTSDTERTSVTLDTKKLLVMIICFSNAFLEEHRNYAISLFEMYANAQNIDIIKVRKE